MQKGVKPVVLDDRVDCFIKWYRKNMAQRSNRRTVEMRDFIEKVAVWYELRYPDFEVRKRMEPESLVNVSASDVMFNQNAYINEQLDEDSEVRVLDWDKFYNFKAFVATLSADERFLLLRPRYPECIALHVNNELYRFKLTSRGRVRTLDDCDVITIFGKNGDKNDLYFRYENLTIEELLKSLDAGSVLGRFELNRTDIQRIEGMIHDYKNACEAREEMLNCIMYRIIERGGDRIGPRRGFMFAQEFGRDLGIPISYGIDTSDPRLREFLAQYLMSGGSVDLPCYVNYFSRNHKYQGLVTKTVGEILEICKNDGISFYTPLEDELHQRLVDALATREKTLTMRPVEKKQ